MIGLPFPARARAVLLVACGLLCAGERATAQSLDGFVELYGADQETTIRNADGTTQQQESRFHWERLWLDYRNLLWPNLELEAGGAFERESSDLRADLLELDARIVELRPFVSLRLRTGLHRIDLDWSHIDTRASAGSFEERRLRDYYALLLGWYPQPRSLLELRLSHTDDRDGNHQLIDQSVDELSLVGLYTPKPWLTLDYRLLYADVEDRIRQAQYDTTTHNGRVYYNQDFLNRRLMIGATYDITYELLGTDIPGSGVIERAVPPIAGLSAITDFPQQVTLEPNPALIDRVLTTGAGINIGLPPAAGDSRPRNFGLDFEIPQAVNTLRVWVDREIRLEAAAAFSWEIWSSPDNVRWTARQVIPRAAFGPFDNRFELHFAAIEARYLKVVVRPLEVGDPFAADYPVILVTELESLLRRDVEGYSATESRTSQRFTFDMRYRLLEDPRLDVLVNYLWRDPGDEPTRDNLLAGLSLFHPFGGFWTVSALGTVETGRELRGRRWAESLNASLSAAPLPTLRATLAGSARSETLAGERLDTGGVNLSATANLYRGVDFTVGYGRSRQDRSTGARTESSNLNALLSLAPRRDLTVSLLYQDASDRTVGGQYPEQRTGRSAGEISLVYTPVPSIYLYAAYRLEWSDYQEDRTLRNMALSWTPFPGARMQLRFRFDEYYDSIFDTVTRDWGAGARWDVASGTWFEVFYDDFRVDSDVQEVSRDLLSATLHFGF